MARAFLITVLSECPYAEDSRTFRVEAETYDLAIQKITRAIDGTEPSEEEVNQVGGRPIVTITEVKECSQAMERLN